MKIDLKNSKIDLANLWQAIGFIYQSDKRLFSARMILTIIQSILPFALLYLLKVLIDEITDSVIHPNSLNLSFIWLYAGLFCGIFLLNRLSVILYQLLDEILTQKLIDFISNLLHKKSTELDLAYYDNSAYHDTFHRAQQEANYRPVQILNNLTGLISNSLSLVGIIIMLSVFSWVGIIILIIAGMPSLWVRLIKSKKLYNWRKLNTPLFRKADYFSMLLTNRIYAKEVRTFNLAAHFREQFDNIRKRLVKQILAITKKLAKLNMLSVIFEAVALMTIIYLLSNKAFTGAITTGSFVMFFEAFRRGQGYVQSLVSNFSGIYENKLFLNNLFDFLRLQPQIKSPEKPIPFPEQIRQGIRFENVSFSYPGTGKKVIRNFNLLAKPGEVTLIQGENGWGKTTLIKLLCRLYECAEGAIYIDNIDIKDFDIRELRKNISVIFQDFVKFDLTVRENITLGDIENRNDIDMLEQASRLSSCKPVIEQLPQRYNTILGKYFENGEELSMGQWQRIALARTLYKESPVLVLDEPASWMDVKTKASFDRNLLSLKNDKILLLISHSTNKKFEYMKIDSFTESNNSKQLVFT